MTTQKTQNGLPSTRRVDVSCLHARLHFRPTPLQIHHGPYTGAAESQFVEVGLGKINQMLERLEGGTVLHKKKRIGAVDPAHRFHIIRTPLTDPQTQEEYCSSLPCPRTRYTRQISRLRLETKFESWDMPSVR
jgi:hypothetical protein